MTQPSEQQATGAKNRTATLFTLCAIQGVFYVVSGIWPLLSPRTFQIVTGFKADFWLAQTVGAMLALSGVVLFLAARAGRITSEIALLGGGLAAVLCVVDIGCVAAPRTTPAYWVDAVVECGLVVAWVIAWRRSGRKLQRR